MAKTTITARAGPRMLSGQAADSGDPVLTILDLTPASVPFVTVINITAAGHVTGMPVHIRVIATVFRGNFQVPVIPVSTGMSE